MSTGDPLFDVLPLRPEDYRRGRPCRIRRKTVEVRSVVGSRATIAQRELVGAGRR